MTTDTQPRVPVAMVGDIAQLEDRHRLATMWNYRIESGSVLIGVACPGGETVMQWSVNGVQLIPDTVGLLTAIAAGEVGTA